MLEQLLAHLVGDYLLQSDWMAQRKTKAFWPAFWHACFYTVPFFFLTHSWWALGVIAGSHFLIDRFRLVRYLNWVKNITLAPPQTCSDECDKERCRIRGPWAPYEPCKLDVWWHPWAECTGTGYHKDRPAWMAVWLMIIADNTLHLLINFLTLKYL